VGQIGFIAGTVTRMTTSKQYDYLNRLSSISSSSSNSFTYQYNPANQRTMNQLADSFQLAALFPEQRSRQTVTKFSCLRPMPRTIIREHTLKK
jgi:hypothetical protein